MLRGCSISATAFRDGTGQEGEKLKERGRTNCMGRSQVSVGLEGGRVLEGLLDDRLVL
jgi:hypothetical protein